MKTPLLASVFLSSVPNAVAETTAELTTKLHSHCQAYGWPVNLVINLRIDLDGGKYHVFVPKAIENEVYALEYGNGTQKEGTHALQSFLSNLNNTDLDDKMFKQLLRIGLV